MYDGGKIPQVVCLVSKTTNHVDESASATIHTVRSKIPNFGCEKVSELRSLNPPYQNERR